MQDEYQPLVKAASPDRSTRSQEIMKIRNRWRRLLQRGTSASTRDPRGRYHGPVAVMIAGEDEVVTAAQGEKLYAGYAGPKKRWFDAAATHNTISNAPTLPWWREVSNFLLAGSRAR